MPKLNRLPALLFTFTLLVSLGVADEKKPTPTTPTPKPKPYGLTKRVPWTTSRLVGTPDPPPPYTLKQAFPKLKFKNPVYIAAEPGSDRLLVAELSGKIYAFTKKRADLKSRELFLDLGREIYSFSFHPRYEENGYVFVFSPKDPKDKAKVKKSRVSRFQAGCKKPRKCSPDSEKVIVEWKAGGHNGGEAIIGPDGYLYISTGDGTSGDDPNKTGQGVDDLFSVIMRIDVEHPQADRAYSIPKDNPFINYPGARPEIWAFGFRNPWRMSFDRPTGRLWVGDVGQDLWEMIWLVKRGGNYGWSVREGDHPFHLEQKAGPGPILPPVIEHHHTECRSITGGYVYHGRKFPELDGVYFYGDYEYGKMWGLRYDGEKVTWHKELADSALRISSFGIGREGEIYALDYQSGEIYQLQRSQATKANRRFPRKLSETGIFASTKDQRPSPGVFPYSVNAPQWLDNATKQRFLAMPGTDKISVGGKRTNAGPWNLGDGIAIAETISLEMEVGDPRSRRRIETRILIKQQGHWLGYTYQWNDAQTDAALVAASGKEIAFTIKDRSAPGGTRRQTWRIASRNECMTCHSRASGFVLGLRTLQMNKDHDYAGVIDNQLRTLSHIGVLANAKLDPKNFDAMPDVYDKAADVSARARAYLHVNCSTCHLGSGGGNSIFTVRYDQKPETMKLIDVAPMHSAFGLAGAKLVAPGDPFSSVLLYRFAKLGRGRMPHMGSRLIDERGIELFHDWIAQLKPEPPDKDAKDAPVKKKPRQHPSYASALKTLAKAKKLPADKRAETIRQLLSSTRGALILSRQIAKEPALDSLKSEIIALGVAHRNVNVSDLFERFVPEERRTKRLGDSINPEDILTLKGDAGSGRRFFFSGAASLCRNCHRVGDVGTTLGPELNQVGKKYNRREILESLLAPSKKIDPKFATHVVQTSKGKIYTGVLVKKTDKQIVLNVLQQGKVSTLRIPVDEIEKLLPQKLSLMPDGLLRDLTAQQAADLLAFLMTLK